MDPFDRQIVQFVVGWAPFGGPPDEDVLPGFGLTPAELRQRFRQIVAELASPESTLSDEDTALLAKARRATFPTRRAPASPPQRSRREQGSELPRRCAIPPQPASTRA
ncbi:hypothetical protein [Mycolicibacterium sp. OfavD-34-C]|uniref:hypothetical protein n=1 Tax=Mycolicibacterium sp. OfavD-34-C TaxID=2917746 RepID=UPI001EF72E8A|nr:hypothetical protein [Mycolicibacterium sp. OfavD-34-C]MCG7578626.1 hypothetical protein [Mycolicibacterium sp. OfavD-34-C]